MAHLADGNTHGNEWVLNALRRAAHQTGHFLHRLGKAATADAPPPEPTRFGSTHGAAPNVYEALDQAITEHLGKLLDEGYIEEESGKRVRVPPCIRPQMISERRLLS